MCIFLFSLNFEHNLEHYVWACKCVLMHAWLHLQVPKDVPRVRRLLGDRQAARVQCWHSALTTAPKTLAQKSVVCQIPS